MNLQESIIRIRQMMGLNEDKIKHIYQPDDISCGPTCIKMIKDHIEENDITIEDIKKIVGTNDIKGTTLDDMIVGLNYLNINYEYPTLNDSETAIKYLNNSMANNNPIILRTLTQGEKHWVIVGEFDGEIYYVKDPWLGEIEYTKEEIIDIWEPRDFDCLKILKKKTNGEITVRKYKDSDKEQVTNIMVKNFSHLMDEKEIPNYIDSVSNYNKSIVVEKGDNIVGVYLLGDRQLRRGIEEEECDKIYVDLDVYDKMNGLEGVALVVDESERGSGIGSKLKDYTKTLGVDYVWGTQYKGLSNLEHWLKRRKLVAESDEVYVTVENL